ncbi:MAG: glucosaminidase [Gammaproteobacteria bacterium]|nr:MAG: glucosaminidase [Gammaproteobacteria bacterium]
MKTVQSVLFIILLNCLCFVTASSPNSKYEQIELQSLDDLIALFERLDYTAESWQKGNREVPRITFESVREKWKTSSHKLPVKTKKQVFFRLMAPLVLMANEDILKERQLAQKEVLDSEALKSLAKKYYVIENLDEKMDESKRQELLSKVDIMPPSLALAQAAEESGWATSRFSFEGNAFFGQWDFSGKGMVPRQQRKELGNYGVARFDSPLASVQGYMFNINTTGAYQKLRTLRAQFRQENKAITGLELAGTLDKYSERGQAYIDSIRGMIRYNKLYDVDEAYLSDNKLIQLVNDRD